MAGTIPVRIAHLSGITAQKARQDGTALLIGKMIELETGERMALDESLAKLLGDAELCGSVLLFYVNIITQYATVSMSQPAGLRKLVDYMISQLEVADG